MPQLDVSTFLPQLVWLAITFIGLYVLMTALVLPRIGRVLAERTDRIEGTLVRAQALRAEAEAARDSYDSALAAARAKAHDEVVRVMERAKADTNSRLEAQAHALAAKAREAEANVERAKDRALAGINEAAAEIAKAAAEKLLGAPVDAGAAQAAVAGVRKGKR
jgi:F-type H+-transporting ATPase subunit b